MGRVLWAPGRVWARVPLMLLLHARRLALAREARLPMRVPRTWDGPDMGDLTPQGKPRRARGAFYLGNSLGRGEELWISREDALTHMLVLGTTGSGKTETLVSLSWNYLAQGSGLLYVDPKAAPKLAAQIYTMCRIMGRDDDFLLLSYMADRKAQETMRRRGHGRCPERQSNTQNPFAVGTANQLTQLLLALMPDEKASGGAIFSNNAQTLISGLMFVLVELRDRGEIALSIGVIRRCLMQLPVIDALARRTDLSEHSVQALRSGLATVGWDMDHPLDQQPRSFAEQYGYARAYFGRALSLLVDNYGRVFMTGHGEVDAVDVITSRRVYVTLIPSVDKDPKELRSLGQICLASVRNACAVGLGETVQGRLSGVLGSLPTDAAAPFGVVVDEYAAIETPGFEMLLTQGRGLGIAVTVASQDFSGIRRASETAAEQIVSNCKVKIFMCQEDPRQTMDLVRSLAGEAWVQRTTGWSARDGGGVSFADNMAVSGERLARVDFRDLQKQVEGQMTVFFKGGLTRARCFHADPPLKPDQEVRLVSHLKLRAPDPETLWPLTSAWLGVEELLADMSRGDFKTDNAGASPGPEWERVAADAARFARVPGIPRFNTVIAALCHGLSGRAEAEGFEEEDEGDGSGGVLFEPEAGRGGASEEDAGDDAGDDAGAPDDWTQAFEEGRARAREAGGLGPGREEDGWGPAPADEDLANDAVEPAAAAGTVTASRRRSGAPSRSRTGGAAGRRSGSASGKRTGGPSGRRGRGGN